MKCKYLLISALLAVTAPLGALASNVMTKPVLSIDEPQKVLVMANINNQFSRMLSANINADVTWIAPVGTETEKGTLLVKLDDRDYKLAVELAKHRLSQSRHQVGYLRRELDSATKLAKTQNLSELTIEKLRYQLNVAVNEKSINQLTLEQAKLDLERTKLYAQGTGVVVSNDVKVGQHALSGQRLLSVVDTKHHEVTALVPVKYASQISKGQTLKLFDQSRQLYGTVRGILPVVEKQAQTMQVILTLDDSAENLSVGQLFSLELQLANRGPQLAISRDALTIKRDRQYVVRVNDKQETELVDVKVLGSSGENLIVQGDLKPNQLVVIRGNSLLGDGDKVTML